MKWKSDFDKYVITVSCESRGWAKTTSDDEWNIFWANTQSVRHLFNPDTGKRLREDQILNHFPNHYELTRKDLMVKNLKRYRREKERELQFLLKDNQREKEMGTTGEATSTFGGRNLSCPEDRGFLDFVPASYLLPTDYSLFLEEYRKNPTATWIMKPANKAQGRGIFLVSRLGQLKKWSKLHNSKNPFQAIPMREPYIISRYIERPFLVGGKKFDLRLYVLVTSYRPLKVYLFREGFARFCTENYTRDVVDFENLMMHLTNVAVQKHAEDYNETHGGKWSLDNLRLFLESCRGKEKTDKLFENILVIVVASLKAVQSVMINDKHCFECYGYDVLIDSQLKPWLVEVNASPSLSTTTEEDRLLKTRLISDILAVVVPPSLDEGFLKIGASWNQARHVGGLDLIVDEGNPSSAPFDSDLLTRRGVSRTGRQTPFLR
uniref:Tubulin--tyrosine ligase-like protein 9 n=1 Tax=Chromera velia CCMP2878 TaxID=1169474 RepID=A0A0G4IG39_9ALVE|eukprot:Cvel_2513.t1-p1 / transcript=Cvel_2513.t1 / gene=Cvel_2513 / organism=Chromera_velia_CCMP2878 / gene_product=Probable tubulin polyglutamylase TTLL1, putative / transcript_product=Probable tubulin polyglutamylase TTLL1, putative / location=Cvel_scaffold99:24216-31162(+) / protein_length=434 / sequence_SO=supercontig / SO=protein_coding / is_pseudo=false